MIPDVYSQKKSLCVSWTRAINEEHTIYPEVLTGVNTVIS